jgi:hypothetical protein
MQVQRVQNNYINTTGRKQYIQNIQNIGFQGGKQQLIAISADSFKSESAKKLCLKMQRYFQMIGKSGSIKDTKLLHEKTHYFSSKSPYIIESEADVCLSINKGEKNSKIKLYHKYADPQKSDDAILDVTLDKNDQMVNGHFLPQSLFFERSSKNLRRMHSAFEKTYLPVGGNDKEWSYLGDKIPSANNQIYLYDDSVQGAFEIFLELARLNTSII